MFIKKSVNLKKKKKKSKYKKKKKKNYGKDEERRVHSFCGTKAQIAAEFT